MTLREEGGGPVPGGRPRAVLFDLFHTLVDVNDAPGEASSAILGIDPLVWNTKIMYDSAHHALGLEADPYESVRRIAHEVDSSIPEARIRAAVEARPKRFRHALLQVRPEILEGLDRLRALGLSLGLISNAGLDEVEAWAESPLAARIPQPLFSCHEKLMKPDPQIYLRAAARLGVAPGECLFVGDGGSHEHDGARAAGMRTVLFLALLAQSAPKLAAARPRNTDFVAGSMPELVELIHGLVAPAAAVHAGGPGARSNEGDPMSNSGAAAQIPGWVQTLPGAITVTDAQGTIIAMNDQSCEVFAEDGGAALIGQSVFDCHPEPARTKTIELYARREPNHYTIRTRQGKRKIIHQMPWFSGGEFAGFVELSIVIPEDLPHFDR